MGLFSLAGRAGVPKPAAIQLMLPMIFFAWKRMCYILMLPINTDDNPHKYYLMIPASITFMLWLNLSNGCASIGAETWADVANFVVIDWLLFFFRIGLCIRFGEKSCKKLFMALLKKQLENVLSPLPNHITAVGSKQAMRVHQAFFCLIEGETLTVCYMLLLGNYCVCGIERNMTHMMSKVSPMRSSAVIFIFMALDLLQDIMGDKLMGKFSSWTFLYRGRGKADGMHCSRILPFVAFGYMAWGDESWLISLKQKELMVRMQETTGGVFPFYDPICPGIGSTLFLVGY